MSAPILLHTLPSPTPQDWEEFGGSIATDGNLVVVGAPYDHTGAASAGAAYIYDATTGGLLHTLLSSPPVEREEFGSSVAVGENLVIVGARYGGPGPNPSGAAHIFSATTGALLRTILSPAQGGQFEFGSSVAISGGLVVVGAPRDNIGAANAGAAYIYDAATGALLHTLLDDAPVNLDRFGHSIAIDQNLVVVGRPATSGRAPAAIVFDVTTGTRLHTLSDPTASVSGEFGFSVSISGGLIAVGAPLSGSGGAHIFSATTGMLLHSLTNPLPEDWIEFGTGVTIVRPLVAVGAPRHGGGAIHTFSAVTGAVLGVTHSPAPQGWLFGNRIAAADGVLAVGAPNISEVAEQFNAGTAYIYQIPVSQWQTGTGLLFPVSGWLTTTLGSPRVGSQHFASGWENWAGFGPPSAHPSARITQNWTTQTQGSSATVFGTAAALSAVAQRASGWATGSLGAPTSRQAFAASGWSSTVVSAATSHSTASQRAAGWVSGGVGAPSARQTLTAAGWATGGLGTPTSHQLFVADGWQAAVIGAATAVFRTQASGFSSTSWGHGRVARRLFATATSPRTRFGSRQTSQQTISGGQPQTATTYQAEGFSETHIGAHSGYASLSARHKPPSVRFGRATVRRATIC